MNDAAAPMSGYGVLRLDGMALALPMVNLREVVPCTGLLPLPSAAPGLAGGIALRGVLVPVLDLRHLLGRAPATPACVVVLVHDGHLLGLAADGVNGILAAEGLALHPVQAEAASGALAAVFRASFRRPDDGTLVSLLDAPALFALPDVPRVADPEPARSAAPIASAATGVATDTEAPDPEAANPQAASATDDGMRALLLVRCGARVLAVDALAVHATLDDPRPEPSSLAQGACRGVIHHLGARMPVVALTALAGLGDTEAGSLRQAFIIDHAPGRVAYLVSEVLDVVRLPAAQVVPVPAFALARPDLVAGSLAFDVLPPDLARRCGALAGPRQVLVLGGEALRGDAEMRALASTLAAPPAAGASAGAKAAPGPAASGSSPADGASSRRAMLVYQLGADVATPIDQVAEILPFRAEPSALPPAPHLLGLQIHRGRTIALLCLSHLVDLPAPCATADTSVLVVEHGGDALGFVVPALRSIESARWSPSLPSHTVAAGSLAAAAGTQHLAEVGEGDQRRLLRVLDLQALAAQLRGSAVTGGADALSCSA